MTLENCDLLEQVKEESFENFSGKSNKFKQINILERVKVNRTNGKSNLSLSAKQEWISHSQTRWFNIK